MRVTDNIRTNAATFGLNDLRQRHLTATEEASSGLKINRPSDEPAIAARLTRSERWKNQTESLARGLSMGRSDLDLAETTLASASDLLKRAKEVAMQAANGSNPAEARASTAQEILGIQSALLGLANTQGMRGYIFAGSQTSSPAFDSSFAFQGDSYEHAIQSGPASEVVISASGARAFTAAGGRDIFQDLTDLATAMTNNDLAGITASLDTLDEAHEQVTLERARVGVNMSRLDQSQEVLTSTRFLIDGQDAALAGADPAESLTNLVGLEQSLQRSMGVLQRLFGLDAFTLLGGR
jgi:flagellar hook-associated protein 3 FlgL